MANGENRAITSDTSASGGPAIVLSAGLAALGIGEAIFILAALILPPAAVQNDSFLVYSLMGEALVALGALLVAGGIAALRGAHWLVALLMLAVAGFAAYGFHWPDWLLPAENNPFRPFIGQFALGGFMFVFFLVVLLIGKQRIWPALWRSLLVAGVVAAAAIALLAWLYSRIS